MPEARSDRMLFRFSLYGFLKNQQYYDPFLILFFRWERGLSFLQIGTLIAFREVLVNLLEVPSGAVADLYGRRKSMILSFISYIAAFLLFARATEYWHFFPAMFLFSIGEVFRTGTHKAMIFDWLKREGREGEKTRVYGFTRSWSKIGSALAGIVAPAIVIISGSFTTVFYFTAAIYVFGIVNFLGYPKYLDGEPKPFSLRGVFGTLIDAFREAFSRPATRRLMIEAMSFDGLYKVNKDYMQPVVKQLALGTLGVAVFSRLGLEGTDEPTQKIQTALVIGIAYFALNLCAAIASRNAHRLVAGGEERGGRIIWLMYGAAHLLLVPVFMFGFHAAAIVGFVVLALLENFWRPTLIARVAARTSDRVQATVLSIESQSRSIFVAAAAPLMGYLVDLFEKVAHDRNYSDSFTFLPIACAGVLVTLIIFLTGSRRRSRAAEAFDTSEGTTV